MPSTLSDTCPAAPSCGYFASWLQLTSSPAGGFEPCGRLFSLAPTVRQFFAVPGDPIESGSITPSESSSTPEFPAENKISMSGWFHMNSSTARAFWL